jgi:cytochrome c oxidase subunit 2
LSVIVERALGAVGTGEAMLFHRPFGFLGLAIEGGSPTSIFRPDATPAHSIFGLSMFILAITGTIFAVVTGLLIYALIKFRQREADTSGEPAQIFGSTQIETAWTVIPLLIVVVMFLTAARVILATQAIPKPAKTLDVQVVGHQFWWEYRYPKQGFVTANELHIPASDPAHPLPTYLEMSSADVIHSFWVPRLAGKLDVVPQHVNTMWFDPSKPGLYLGQCAQYCGVNHAKMLLRVYVDSPEDFAAWVKRQQAVPEGVTSTDPAIAEGKLVFEKNACVNCHTVSGTVAKGRFGPDLTHVGSRDTIASGAIENTPENLRKWIEDPNQMKPGALMPAMRLNDRDLDAVTKYMTALR